MRFPELDVLRGLAVIFMIANHLGVATQVSETSPVVWFLTFVGSMAPVLFFFVTGLGYGVGSASAAQKSGGSFLTKFLVLMAADVFLWLQPDLLAGTNFLGFIAISGLLLEGIRRLPRSGLLSAGLLVLVLVVRFGVGPYVRSHHLLNEHGWGALLLGINSLPGFAYPPCPWLTYPLLGYLLGRWAGLSANRLGELRGALGVSHLVLGAGGLTLGVWLVRRGNVLFRWGTMSVSFFVISLGVVAVCVALALALCARANWARARALVSISGVRSFAVVPLHYLYRDLVLRTGATVANGTGYLVWLIAGIFVCFQASKLVPQLTTALLASRRVQAARWVIVALTVLAAGSIVAGVVPEWADVLVRSTAQFSLCVLFGLLGARPAGASALQQGVRNPARLEREPHATVLDQAVESLWTRTFPAQLVLL